MVQNSVGNFLWHLATLSAIDPSGGGLPCICCLALTLDAMVLVLDSTTYFGGLRIDFGVTMASLDNATINLDFFSFPSYHSPSLSANSTRSVNLTLGCGTKVGCCIGSCVLGSTLDEV